MLAAAMTAADSTTDSLVYSLSLQTAVFSVELQLFVFNLLLTILFYRIRIHYSTYYSVQMEYK